MLNGVIDELTQTLHMAPQPVCSSRDARVGVSLGKVGGPTKKKLMTAIYQEWGNNRGKRSRSADTKVNHISGYPKSLYSGGVLTDMLFLIWLQWLRST